MLIKPRKEGDHFVNYWTTNERQEFYTKRFKTRSLPWKRYSDRKPGSGNQQQQRQR